MGAANAGKSAFIRRLLDRLEVKFPQGKVEQCAPQRAEGDDLRGGPAPQVLVGGGVETPLKREREMYIVYIYILYNMI